ncbi:DUF669 domain-containing protein [Moraxella catarrhalis]|uniref:DUF669 domain-containing protein n=1 Tax=Moraxella catarrhalis TaxID=480 RepID=UPI000721ADD8|nr:DUF669 domain-containing protein [Moraxella catarrhalis]AKI27783.1 hypothetical protein [Moraxella phage Mcat18]AKI27954.1 hypothetical protein [Moraxella phage Mcat22]MCG6832588.1 DUF669 domain-containing protein [Moraxella catarrhalis]MPW55283.1 DUF669 domain-containing protein [Moraxella catarrhalis]MPW59225.1 DUF669 domain-containing protein [Moraxella catarrhalis]
MATLNFGFTQEEVQAAQNDSYTALPAGNYIAQVERSEVKQTKDGTGSYLSLGFKILEGDYSGRMLFGNITLTNKNSQAQEIGRKQLIKLSTACGLGHLQDSEQLHGIAVMIKVSDSRVYEGEKQNDIKDYKPAPAIQLSGFTQSPPTQTASSNKPWVRG